MIERPKYVQKLIDSRNNGFPKVITGIRRCGKSFLLKEIYLKYLLENGVTKEQILLIELDDDRNVKYRDPLVLANYVREYCQNKQDCYVFLDEIQKVYTIVNPELTNGNHVLAKESDEEVVSFVDVILGLSRERNIDIYVTGSNSKMLSTDIITEFRDKATNIHLLPLSFEEYYNYVNKSFNESLYSYMQYGGMPLAVLKNNNEKKEYLKNLFETTYFKDIVEHNKLRKSESLDELCNIISESVGYLINSEKISKLFINAKRADISNLTVEKYLNMFIDSFILKEARRFDLKGKKEVGALRKYYFTDVGLRNARLNFAFKDDGQILENIIYNELCYNDYSVNVGTFDSIEKNKNNKSIRKTNEIDFYATKGNRSYYIQVCFDIDNAKTKKRETRPFFMLNDQIQKVLVINKPLEETRDINGFTVIGLEEFLLKFIK